MLTLTPTTTFADCPQLDVICVPGGFGTDDMINDEEMLAFLRQQAPGAKYITSVCTGSLVLGAAGLLKGYRAATHWTAMDFLSSLRRDPDQDARLRRPQPRHRRRRHRRDRFRADAGVAAARPEDRGGDPAPARIQSRAAVQLRLARHRAAGSACLHERQDCSGANTPRRNDRPRRRAAGRRRSFGRAAKPRQARKRPPGFPDGLSFPTAATHWRAISEPLHRGPISRPCPIGGRC